MEAYSADELLVRQREKLNANAAWIRRQQMRMQNTDGYDGNAADADENNMDDIVMRGTGAGVKAQEGMERNLAQEEEFMKTELTPSAGQRQSVGSVSRQIAVRQASANPRSPGDVGNTANQGDFFTTVRGGSVLRVQKRNALWQIRRQQKLEEKRTLHAEDYSQYTFSPKIHGYSGNASGSAFMTAPGVEEFLQRQERAREIARMKEERGRVDGSKWVHRLTVAEPFVFGQRPEIESLRPPLQNVPGTLREILSEGETEFVRSGKKKIPVDSRRELLPDTPASFETIAEAAGVSLPPPGAFSSWALLYCGGEAPNDSKTEKDSTPSQ
ncbi:hypothetical protein Tc00.1047053510359.80 [Trypanosoma cruzi]|uniref:Uncharacterized protein n=1 Tax=Trypanosoma cruzi (strain CL Brener) TaxID=353153 RepID=Q4E561_TRYCC|nr:hypothetical protein Tc00.1047053510359.80 [Trypanosoma cruzi]EAN99881.1 hypothetical protein Tc00.1047053510359.80 [Trypanosoma cruzi]|eukprot:XP_821732.1 hypothetical protein [Trypanosoma cruzi strain CL Brener]